MITQIHAKGFSHYYKPNMIDQSQSINSSMESYAPLNKRYDNYIKNNKSKLGNQNSKSQENIPNLKNTSLVLNGYNVVANKYEKEQKVLNFIPLIELRTFGQLRRHFQSNKDMRRIHKMNKFVDSKHYDDIKGMRQMNDNTKTKILYNLSHNSIGILDNFSSEQIDTMFLDDKNYYLRNLSQ